MVDAGSCVVAVFVTVDVTVEGVSVTVDAGS